MDIISAIASAYIVAGLSERSDLLPEGIGITPEMPASNFAQGSTKRPTNERLFKFSERAWANLSEPRIINLRNFAAVRILHKMLVSLQISIDPQS